MSASFFKKLCGGVLTIAGVIVFVTASDMADSLTGIIMVVFGLAIIWWGFLR